MTNMRYVNDLYKMYFSTNVFLSQMASSKSQQSGDEEGGEGQVGLVPPLHWLYVQNEITLLFWGESFLKISFDQRPMF